MRQKPRPSVRRPVVARRARKLPTKDELEHIQLEKKQTISAAQAIKDYTDTMKGIAYAKERKNWIVVSTREAQAYLDSL